MTCGREHVAGRVHDGKSADVSHSAELVRGDFYIRGQEGPLIRPVSPEASLRLDGAPSPQGEKGGRSACSNRRVVPQLARV